MRQFNNNSAVYDAIRDKIAYPEALYQHLAQLCRYHEAALDIACGTGISTARLANHFIHVEGVDFGQHLIDKARENYPKIGFSVSKAETFVSPRTFDLVTCATAFYWLNRDRVLKRLPHLLSEHGVFCAYRYEFPVVYGPLRRIIERELVDNWANHRDQRLTLYDDTLEKMEQSGVFRSSERMLVGNILELSPREIALFFLSTSYVTQFIDREGGPGYATELLAEIDEVDAGAKVKVNFDIQAFVAVR